MKVNSRHFLRSSRFAAGRLALLFVLFVLLVGAAQAQEDDRPEVTPVQGPGIPPDGHENGQGPEIPPVEILKEELSPDGVNIVVQIPVSKDSYISSANPNTNYGAAGTSRIGYQAGGAGATRIVLQFDLSSIPSNVVINEAEFQYYLAQSVPASDAPMLFLAQYMIAPWSEYGVTWNNASYLGGTGLPIGEVPSTVGWHYNDGTAAIQAWHSGAQANHGVLITADERPDQNRSRVFYTREQPGYFPRLIVDYTISCDTLPPVATVSALPAYSPGSFQVQWSGTDPAQTGCASTGISYYDVQYRVNGGSWVAWKSQTTDTSGTIQSGTDGSLYEFRARAVDKSGNIQPFGNPQASTRVDTLPPSAEVQDLPQYTFSSSFFVQWTGSDNLSGITTYDVQWRESGGIFDLPVWQTLVENTAQTSIQFTGAQNGKTYDFRARARDAVGNVQPFSDLPQAHTTVVTNPIATVEPFNPPVLKPTALITDTFTVSWEFFSGPTTPDETRIFYRYDGGAWQLWDTFDYPQLNAQFPWEALGHGDGIYQFEAVAINTIGQIETQTLQSEAVMWVDMADIVQVRAYLPLAYKNP